MKPETLKKIRDQLTAYKAELLKRDPIPGNAVEDVDASIYEVLAEIEEQNRGDDNATI